MPIRLNLLAEAQAEEELRRRDPVKRAIWGGGFLVACVLIYYFSLIANTWAKRSELSRLEAGLEANKTKYQEIVDNEKRLSEITREMDALHHYACSRFLWGNVLNALQLSTLNNVNLLRFRADQSYEVTEDSKAKAGEESGRRSSTKPSFVTQHISMMLEAKDISPTPGDQINDYKLALTKAPFFGSTTNTSEPTVTLKNLSAPTLDPESGRMAVMFGLECRFADKVIK